MEEPCANQIAQGANFELGSKLQSEADAKKKSSIKEYLSDLVAVKQIDVLPKPTNAFQKETKSDKSGGGERSGETLHQ